MNKQNLLSLIKTLLKFSIAMGIIIYLVRSGKIDFALVPQSFLHPWHWVACFVIIALQALITVVRWKILLEIKHEGKLPLFPMIKLTWIGMFFSSILPGAVTGDLIKVVYARDLSPKINKTYLLTSALLDRLFGLLGLLFGLGFFSLLNYEELTNISTELTRLIHTNFFVFFLMILGFWGLMLPLKLQTMIRKLAVKIPGLNKSILKTLDQIWLVGQNKKVLAKCFLLSVFTQSLLVLAFYTLTSPFYEQDLPLRYAFTFIPVGMIAVAIPIAPAGLGIGHAIFNWLFGFFHISKGASLFNLYFIATMSFNLVGSIFYITSGKKNAFQDAQKLQEEENSKA